MLTMKGKYGYILDPWKELSSCLVSRGMSHCIVLTGGRDGLSKECVVLDATDSILQSHRANITGHSKPSIKPQYSQSIVNSEFL